MKPTISISAVGSLTPRPTRELFGNGAAPDSVRVASDMKMELDERREWICRFVAIEGTLAWAHDEVVIEFRIRALGDNRVAVHAKLEYYGNYWDNWKEPRTATADLTGVMLAKPAGSATTTIDIDQPAPLQILSLDLDVPLVDVLFVTGKPMQLPAFILPMIELAERQGIEFYDLPDGMSESLGWPQPWNRPKYVNRADE